MEILFVCTGNTCRSPMAEGIFNALAKDLPYTASSGGISAFDGDGATAGAVMAVKKYNASLLGHRARRLSKEILDNADIVLCMTGTHKAFIESAYPEYRDKIYTLYEFIGEDGQVTDPFGGDNRVYDKCAEQIYNALVKVIDRLNKKG